MAKLQLTPLIGMIFGLVVSFAVFFPISYYIDIRFTESLLEEERAEVLGESARLKGELEANLNLALSLTKGMEAPYAIKSDLSLAEFNLLAEELISNLSYVRNLAITDGTIFKYVYPLEGNESVLGVDYQEIPAQWPAIKAAIDTKTTVIAGPLKLIQGGTGLIQRTPVYQQKQGVRGAFIGLVSVVINVESLLAPISRTNLVTALRKLDKKGKASDVFWGSANLFENKNAPVITNIFLRGGAWQMATAPSGNWGSRIDQQIEQTHMVLYGFLICILLVFAYAGYYEVNRRQLSNAFKEGRTRYLGLMENAPDAMVFMNRNGKIEEANRKAMDLFAFNGGLVGRSFDALLPPLDNAGAFTNWDQLLKSIEKEDALEAQEAKIQNGQGDVFDAEISLGFAGDSSSRQIIATLRDVTEKRQLQYERNLAEEILREAIDTIPDGFAIYDQNDQLYLFNDAYAQIYAASFEVLRIGVTFREILQFGLKNGQYPQAGKSLEEQTLWLNERIAAHRNPNTKVLIQQTNNKRWLRITERRTASDLIVGIRTDITDIKATEAELRDKQDLLELQATELRALAKEYLEEKVKAEDATQAKSEFLAIVSHELRTPMTGILGLTDIMLSSNPSTDHQLHLEQLKISALNLLELLNDILDFSKFEAGKLDLEDVDFDLVQIVNAVTELLEPVAGKKEIELGTDINISDAEKILRGDGNRLRQVLLNLTSNAIKFTEKGTVKIKVNATTCDDNNIDLKFSISDTGIGISEKQIETLFAPFTQADSSTTRKFGGTGLGLSICKSLVDAMDGDIYVKSVPGEGSTFHFGLQLPKGDLSRLQQKNEKTTKLLSKEPLQNRRGLNILLAEDVDINRMIVSTVLKKWGHTVEEAVNGKEAVRKASGSDHYDLILMDMQMPEMDGCDAAIAIRKLQGANSNIPIVALTADIQASQNARYNKAGLDAFLNKPVDWNMLEEVIEKYCA